MCNWMVPADDSNPLCESCRLTRTIPTLVRPDNHLYWYRLEQAKRRRLYTLWLLGLSTDARSIGDHGAILQGQREAAAGLEIISRKLRFNPPRLGRQVAPTKLCRCCASLACRYLSPA
ncbi:zinc-ribbon domain-containing protein [Cupriavidus sp. USMAA2-4]|uniref:zinc-ribbon domain-containing protein n=1 Tax=Cupriavidus sp. USMAA2-4 TaxID=876364 RepID=UPI003FA49E17